MTDKNFRHEAILGRSWCTMALFVGIVVACIFSCLSASTASAATAETEPNNSIFQANGPVASSPITGALSTANDFDVFMINFRPQRQVRLTASTTTGYCRIHLLAFDGTELWAPYLTAPGDPDTTTFTTPGIAGGASTRALLHVSDGPCAYAFSITALDGSPGDSIDPSPLPAIQNVLAAEPNDGIKQAFGPISAGVYYSGTLETSNDQDWLVFGARKGKGVQVEFAKDVGDIVMDVEGADGWSNQWGPTSKGEHYCPDNTGCSRTFNVPATGFHRLNIHYRHGEGPGGTNWRVIVTPADAMKLPAPTATVVRKKVRRGKKFAVRINYSLATSLTYSLRRGKRVVATGSRSIIHDVPKVGSRPAKGGTATIPTKKLRKGSYKLRLTVDGLNPKTIRVKIT